MFFGCMYYAIMYYDFKWLGRLTNTARIERFRKTNVCDTLLKITRDIPNYFIFVNIDYSLSEITGFVIYWLFKIKKIDKIVRPCKKYAIISKVFKIKFLK